MCWNQESRFWTLDLKTREGERMEREARNGESWKRGFRNGVKVWVEAVAIVIFYIIWTNHNTNRAFFFQITHKTISVQFFVSSEITWRASFFSINLWENVLIQMSADLRLPLSMSVSNRTIHFYQIRLFVISKFVSHFRCLLIVNWRKLSQRHVLVSVRSRYYCCRYFFKCRPTKIFERTYPSEWHDKPQDICRIGYKR